VISLRGIRKSFRDGDQVQVVLDGLDLEARPGELVAVVGPSGSGKSSLLYIAGGLDADFEGEAVVGGFSLRTLSARERAAFRNAAVGFVFQSFNLLPSLSALENVMLPGFFADSSGDKLPRHGSAGGRPRRLSGLRAEALAALDRVGLNGKEQKLPARLSGGERQRVAIARALLARPAVLLADEPTGNLDTVSGASIIALFEEMARSGMTVLVVTHEERVSRAASRLLHLDGGRLR
jgi:putative ABC transport system ATP-binding protein